MHKTNIILSVAAVLSLSVVLPAQQLAPKTQATPEGLTAGQWTSIRAAYEAGRHAVSKVDGTYQARNPGQGWLTRFEDGGFEVKPDAGAWTWGLKLKSYGFVGHEQEVSTPSEAQADGGRMSYRWDALLEEWFLNDTRGLEHGYTVHQRPSRDAGDTTSPLTFTLAVRGGLSPQITGDQRGVRFVDSNGGTALTYTGLTVFDADGKDVPARFERRGDLLRLLVEEADARYPLTIDPIVRQAYLKASNTDAGDYFGCSVSISGDTVVVGAPYEASNAKGVNRDQSDNSAKDAGAAYVFVRSAGAWTQQAYLKASNTDAYDFFGQSVSISGDTVVVGALGEASNAKGVNRDQSDNSAARAGAAYVFVRSAGTWTQQAYLKASNTDAGDEFGNSVAISGDTVVVGARFEDSNATGVNGDQSDNSARDAGAAYVFVRSGSTWAQQAYLKASNTDALDYFGYSVSMELGTSISGDTVVVGARGEDSNAKGVNGDQSNNSAYYAGAAYVFVRSAGTWTQQAYLKASNTDARDEFGRSVSISGDTVVVGARGEDSNARGVNGNQSNNSATGAGAAYVFVRSAGTWTQQAYLKASNTDADDEFGYSVSISGVTVVVGAPGEASNAKGVNGDQSNNSASYAGAAYVFHLDSIISAAYSVFGQGCASSPRPVALTATTLPKINTTFTLRVSNLAPFTAGILLFGISNTTWNGVPLPLDLSFLGMKGCNLLVSWETQDRPFVAPQTGGMVEMNYPIPNNPAFEGLTFYNQAWVIDAKANAFGVGTSNGGKSVIGY